MSKNVRQQKAVSQISFPVNIKTEMGGEIMNAYCLFVFNQI